MRHKTPRIFSNPIVTAGVMSGLVLLFLSCSAQQEMSVFLDGSGRADLEIEIHDVLVSYMRDLSGAGSGGSSDNGTFEIFDLEEIERTFASRPEIELVSVDAPEASRLRVRLGFPDLSDVLSAAPGVDGIISITRQEQYTEMKIRLGPAEVRRIMQLSPLSGTLIEEVLVPSPEHPMTPDEYREYIAWALEEYEETARLARIIDDSLIVLKISVEGQLISQTGGRRERDTVLFEIPVTELLTIQHPREYSVRYR
jgi:hypothetical protein